MYRAIRKQCDQLNFNFFKKVFSEVLEKDVAEVVAEGQAEVEALEALEAATRCR